MWSILDSFFGGIGSAISDAIDWLYSLVAIVFGWLYQLIANIADWIAGIVGKVTQFLSWVWKSIVKDVLANVWNAVKATVSWLHDNIPRLIAWLQRLRQMINRYFNLYVRPFLDMLQRIRQYLQILSALHIGFAQKLDAYLAQIQGKIVQAYATVIGTINTITDVVNALMDPTYLLRKPALLLSIRRQIPALVRVLTGRQPGYFFGAPGLKGKSAWSLPKLPLPGMPALPVPPASNFLSTDDGIGDFSGFVDSFTIGDGAADETQPLPYFDDSLYPASPCTDPVQCLVTVAKKAAA